MQLYCRSRSLPDRDSSKAEIKDVWFQEHYAHDCYKRGRSFAQIHGIYFSRESLDQEGGLDHFFKDRQMHLEVSWKGYITREAFADKDVL